MILFEKLKQNFCKNFVGKTNIIMETDRKSRKCATIAHLTMSLMCFLRQLRWTPCSADPIKMSWSLSRWFERLQFISKPLTIRHSHIFQNTPCLPPKILQKHCFQLLLGPIPRRKYQRVWKNKRGAKLGRGASKVYHGRCKWGIARLDQQPCSHGFFRHFLTEKLWRRVCLKTVAYGTFQSSQTCQEDVESFVQTPR